MERTTCPFLGLQDDPNTALSFPSEGNACHRANPVAPVEISHQEKYCLGPAYKACPIYQAGATEPVPAMFAASSFTQDQRKRRRVLIAVPIVAALIVGLGMIVSPLLSKFGLLGASAIPNTGPSNEASSMGLLNPQATAIPLLASTVTLTPSPVSTVCQPPEGWAPYMVNPTDSLFRLSAVYGVSVADLQKANCMGEDTVILPGHIIYVPFLPSPTPTPTSTAVVILQPTQLPPKSNNPAPTATQQPNDSNPNPSPIPPTLPVNTPVPPSQPTQAPTKQPPPPKATAQPKPTDQPQPTAQPKPTREPKPTQAPKPTHEPKPTKPPKGGHHGGGGKGHG